MRVGHRVSARPLPLLKRSSVAQTSVKSQMASGQERRKAERDAAKRAPRAGAEGAAGAAGAAGAVGAAGAAGAAAALANLNVHVTPLGDWTTQAADPYVLSRSLGPEILKQQASAGDGQGLTPVHFSAQRKRFLWHRVCM